MDFFNATTMPWYGSIPSGCCHLVHDSTVHSRLFLELSSAAQNGVKLFLIFIFLPWCYMKLCYHKLFLQRVLFTPWPQLLICKKNIFCYYAVLLFSCGALQLKLVFGTITFIHCYFEVEAVLFHFGQFFFILVNSQWIDFFLIKLLHLQIYFWSPKICGTYSLKVCKV